MLKGIPVEISPDLLYILASMGHGDQIVIVDEYYPALSKTDSKRVVYTKGIDAKTIIKAITRIFPLDQDFSDSPVQYMVADDFVMTDSLLDIHKEVKDILIKMQVPEDKIKPIRRSDFYKTAQKAFATVSTSETGAYGCFILQKGLH